MSDFNSIIALRYNSPLAQKVQALLDSDEKDAGEDAVALSVRNAILECLTVLASHTNRHVKASVIPALRDGKEVPRDILERLYIMGFASEINMFMLMISQQAPRGKTWWQMQIALLSSLEMRAGWFLQVELTKDEEANEEKKEAAAEEAN